MEQSAPSCKEGNVVRTQMPWSPTKYQSRHVLTSLGTTAATGSIADCLSYRDMRHGEMSQASTALGFYSPSMAGDLGNPA